MNTQANAQAFNAEERIADLERTLLTLWGETTAAFLVSDPKNEKTSAVFYKTDRDLRRLGLLAKVWGFPLSIASPSRRYNMNATQAENLRVLIRHMETSCHRTLYMGVVFDCGTPACAIGEAAAIGLAGLTFSDGGMRHGGDYLLMDKAVNIVFGLVPVEWGDALQAHRLFCAASHNAWGRNDVTPQEWAIEARKVLAENGYSMEATSDGFDKFMAKVREPVSLGSYAASHR